MTLLTDSWILSLPPAMINTLPASCSAQSHKSTTRKELGKIRPCSQPPPNGEPL